MRIEEMTIQAKLDNEAISYFPAIKELIANSESFEASQMRCRILRMINDEVTPICELSDKQLSELQNNYIDVFKYNSWID
jgi:hypothetical protein